MISSLPSTFLPLAHTSTPLHPSIKPRSTTHRPLLVVSASSSSSPLSVDSTDKADSSQRSTRLITFLGKGGSGKTTSAVFAAQHYAMAGFNTCLVIQTQDPTAEYLLGHKIGPSPVRCSSNLSAVRLETTQMLLEPLDRLKEADKRLNMTQGVLEGVVGKELGVLLGMDSIFSALALERLVGFFGNIAQRNHQKDKFDIVIYDGSSTEETIRMIGASSKGRLYLKYMRSLTEKTDIGRLVGPSLLRLVDETVSISSNKSPLDGKMSSEILDSLERLLERGASAFSEPSKFGCFLVMDPNSPASVNSAMRYWGCTIQAGAQVSGAVAPDSPDLSSESKGKVKELFLPLAFAFTPHLSMSSSLDWNEILQNNDSEDARYVLNLPTSPCISMSPRVKFEAAKKSVTLFMPGFDKSGIKLYQFRGGSELLVEAGDQRRVIHLPPGIQGKVGGAKFVDRNLVVTMI